MFFLIIASPIQYYQLVIFVPFLGGSFGRDFLATWYNPSSITLLTRCFKVLLAFYHIKVVRVIR